MKKYVLTETQIKKVVDTLINEQLTDMSSLVYTVQCFLRQNGYPKLVVDGKSGPNSQTEIALKSFQQKKGVEPDGQWGYRTQSTLTPQENNIWVACRKKYERP
jgi:peptidoglycan hydrolase-like protein with peptidoglycan-binding domain